MIRPDPHPDERVRARSTEGIEIGATIREDDVIDDEAGIGDVVESQQSGVGGWGSEVGTPDLRLVAY